MLSQRKACPGTGLEVLFRHLGDGTIEGLINKEADAISVQFHPEASPGPEDAGFIFDNFLSHVHEVKGHRNEGSEY